MCFVHSYERTELDVERIAALLSQYKKKKKLVLCDQCVGRSTQLKKNDCTEDVKLRLNHYHNCPFTVTITCLYINFYCNRSW